jgi:hypothetical protein
VQYKEFGGHFLVANIQNPQTYRQIVRRSISSITPSPQIQTIKAFCKEEDKNFQELLYDIGQRKLRHVQNILIYLNADLILLERNETGSHDVLNKLETPAKLVPYRLIKNISHYSNLIFK